MPNCKEHANCDLVCEVCGSYYCSGDHLGYYFRHVPHEHPADDMPDDREAYYNERAEQML